MLLQKSTLAYEAPDFSQIKSEDFAPALQEAISEQQAAITAIVEDTSPASFANTILALEKSGEALLRVSNLFFALAGADTNEVLQQTEKEILPLLAAQEDSIYLNDKLFERVQTLYKVRTTLGLDAESLKLLSSSIANWLPWRTTLITIPCKLGRKLPLSSPKRRRLLAFPLKRNKLLSSPMAVGRLP